MTDYRAPDIPHTTTPAAAELAAHDIPLPPIVPTAPAVKTQADPEQPWVVTAPTRPIQRSDAPPPRPGGDRPIIREVTPRPATDISVKAGSLATPAALDRQPLATEPRQRPDRPSPGPQTKVATDSRVDKPTDEPKTLERPQPPEQRHPEITAKPEVAESKRLTLPWQQKAHLTAPTRSAEKHQQALDYTNGLQALSQMPEVKQSYDRLEGVGRAIAASITPKTNEARGYLRTPIGVLYTTGLAAHVLASGPKGSPERTESEKFAVQCANAASAVTAPTHDRWERWYASRLAGVQNRVEAINDAGANDRPLSNLVQHIMEDDPVIQRVKTTLETYTGRPIPPYQVVVLGQNVTSEQRKFLLGSTAAACAGGSHIFMTYDSAMALLGGLPSGRFIAGHELTHVALEELMAPIMRSDGPGGSLREIIADMTALHGLQPHRIKGSYVELQKLYTTLSAPTVAPRLAEFLFDSDLVGAYYYLANRVGLVAATSIISLIPDTVVKKPWLEINRHIGSVQEIGKQAIIGARANQTPAMLRTPRLRR